VNMPGPVSVIPTTDSTPSGRRTRATTVPPPASGMPAWVSVARREKYFCSRSWSSGSALPVSMR